MRKTFEKIIASVLLLTFVASFCTAGAYKIESALYSNSSELTDGLTYTNRIFAASNGRVETFSLEINPGKSAELITTSCDTVYGGMKPDEAIRYAESLGYNVVAAVNTDFFSTANHIPLGLVIENGIYKSSPEGGNALIIDENGCSSIVRAPEISIALTNLTQADSENEAAVSVTHFNKYRSDTELYLYSADFSGVSTRAPSEGWAVRFKILSGSVSVGEEAELSVEEVLDGVKDVPIGEGYLVLTAAAGAGFDAERNAFSVGDTVRLDVSCADERVVTAKWASGGGDVLMENGAVTDSAEWDRTISGANPRTAVGVKADGSAVLLVVDGRRSSYSNGASLSSVSEALLSAGCVSAMNLDGGGSSSMSVRLPGESACTVVNSPSDGAARKCGSFALVVNKNRPDGTASRLFLKNDGAFVLAGASVPLEYLASDASQSPADCGRVKAKAQYGSIEGNIYTAPKNTCTDTVTLSSGSASGTGTLHIVSSPDEFRVIGAKYGKNVETLSLSRGETVTLVPVIKHLTRAVAFDENSVVFSTEGDIGSFSELGTFTSGEHSNVSGALIVTAGERTLSVPFSIPAELEDVDGHWCEEYVKELHRLGIVSGVTETSYSPDSEIRRCDFLLMLYRAQGQPAPAGECTFSDVPADAYFARAVAWAQENGIAAGLDDGTFSPGAALSREQGFTFIYRYLTMLGRVTEETPGADLSAFSDASEISGYAERPVSVLVSLGTVSGDGGAVTPRAPMTRGQMAKVLFKSL